METGKVSGFSMVVLIKDEMLLGNTLGATFGVVLENSDMALENLGMAVEKLGGMLLGNTLGAASGVVSEKSDIAVKN